MRRQFVHDIFSQRPFKPLLVRMVSGQSYRVLSPEFMIAPWHCAFMKDNGVIAVVAMEFIEEIGPLAKNGKHARRPRKRGGKK